MKYIKPSLFALTLIVSGCETGNTNVSPTTPRNYSLQELSAKKEEITKIKYQHSCRVDLYQDVYNFINAYLRDSASSEFNVLNNEAYRNHVAQSLTLTGKYIAPSYITKYYITPETSIITDSYGKNKRKPELICIKKNSEHEYEANILTYWEKMNDFAVVDKLVVVVEGDRKYIYPQEQVSNVPAEDTQVYSDIGVRVMPTSQIRVLKKIFTQRPFTQ